MDQEKKERWVQLCELASKEQDPARLLRLVVEINRLMDEEYDSPKADGDVRQTM
jgi:hypothetical protein